MSRNQAKIPLPGEHQYELCCFAIGPFMVKAHIIDDKGTIGLSILGEDIGSITGLPGVPNIQLLPQWETHFDPVDVFVLVNHVTRAWQQRSVRVSPVGVLVLSDHIGGALDILHEGIEYEVIPDQFRDEAYMTGKYNGEDRQSTGVIRRTGLFGRYRLQCPSRQFPILRDRQFSKTLLNIARGHLEMFWTIRDRLFIDTKIPGTPTDTGPTPRPTPKPSPTPRPGSTPPYKHKVKPTRT